MARHVAPLVRRACRHLNIVSAPSDRITRSAPLLTGVARAVEPASEPSSTLALAP